MGKIALSRKLWVGIMMLGLGFEIWFVNDLSLPLGFVWIVGPLLWYGGFAVVTFVFVSSFLLSATFPQNPQVKTSETQTPDHAGKAATIIFSILVGLLVLTNIFAAGTNYLPTNEKTPTYQLQNAGF